MKTEIHPTYYPEAKVTCACGNSFTLGATKEKLEVEICSNCHPFYTGQDKIVDKVGRVQKFKEKLAKKSTAAKAKADKQEKEKGSKTKQQGRARVTTKAKK